MQGFTMVLNKVLRDTTLSLEAKGLFALLSDPAEEFEQVVYDLLTIGKTEPEVYEKALRELKAAGYLP